MSSSSSKNLSNNALALISLVLETVNHETESVFKIRSSAIDARIVDCRLLEARFTERSDGFAIRFSEDLVFQIVDLMTGGASCHFTKIIDKPFTTFELSVIEHSLGWAFGVRPTQLVDLGKHSNSAASKKIKSEFGFTIAGPKSECAAYVTPPLILNSPQDSHLGIRGLNSLAFSLDSLQLDVMAEILRYELPQTCAFALQMMNRDSAGALLKMLPWELQQDVGIRFVTMVKGNATAKELLLRTCHANSQLCLKIAQ